MNAWRLTVALWLLLSVAPPGAQADEALQLLAARLGNTDVLAGEFEQIRHVSVLAVPLHSSGTFRYQRGDGIVWHTLNPMASEVRIIAGEGVVVVDDTGELRPVPATELVAGIFLDIFAGDLDRLSDYFTATHEPHSDGWILHLTPRLPALARQIDDILLAGGDHVERVEIHDANGDRSELLLRTLTVTLDGATDSE